MMSTDSAQYVGVLISRVFGKGEAVVALVEHADRDTHLDRQGTDPSYSECALLHVDWNNASNWIRTTKNDQKALTCNLLDDVEHEQHELLRRKELVQLRWQELTSRDQAEAEAHIRRRGATFGDGVRSTSRW